MTTIYFVRHAKIEYTADDHSRPLSKEGRKSVPFVTEFFKEIDIDAVISSPYIRAIHTIEGVSKNKGLDILTYHDLRERKVANTFIEDFRSFTTKQWEDFDYKLEGGESLNEVQKRGIETIHEILDTYSGKQIILGTHGTFLAVQLNYFDPTTYDYQFWRQLRMPEIVKATFKGKDFIMAEKLPVATQVNMSV